MRVKREPLFASEAELCNAFIAWAQPQGWTAYPETAGFDILLAHGDGTQIGIQAKLKFNMQVLSQIVPDRHEWPSSSGPDYLAILVPECGSERLCEALGVTPIVANRHSDTPSFAPSLESRRSYAQWHYTNYAKRCTLPKYVPDVQAGASAPSQLTRWKIAALEIVAILELRGWVDRSDFRAKDIDIRRWREREWLQPHPGRPGAWIPGRNFPNFAAQHPVVYPQVLEDIRTTLPPGLGQDTLDLANVPSTSAAPGVVTSAAEGKGLINRACNDTVAPSSSGVASPQGDTPDLLKELQ